MENKYITFKFDENEIEIIKRIMAEKVLEYMNEERKEDFENRKMEQPEKYATLRKQHNLGRKILDVIEYFERLEG